MSYKDLEEAQKKRTEKDTAKAKSKGKHSRKRKSAVSEAEEATAGKGNYCRKRKSTTLETDTIGPKVKVVQMSKALKLVRTLVSSI
jgi:hypothetical protein